MLWMLWTACGPQVQDSVVLEPEPFVRVVDTFGAYRADGMVEWFPYGTGQENRDILGIPEVPFRTVSLATRCGIDTDGGLRCWGEQAGWQTPEQELPDKRWVDLIGNFYGGYALGEDGEISSWRADEQVEYPYPAPAGPFKQVISSGCGLSVEGEIQCWSPDSPLLDTPSGSYVSIDHMDYRYTACALDSGGDVVCWGRDEVVYDGPPLQSFEALENGIFGLDLDGYPVFWGDWDPEGASMLPAQEYLSIAAREDIACGVRAQDNRIVCAGEGVGQLVRVIPE